MGRRGEPRKRPGPDVIGHQLTVLRARAPPAAATVSVAEVAAPAVPPPAAGLGIAAAALRPADPAPGTPAQPGAGADSTHRPRCASGLSAAPPRLCRHPRAQEPSGRENVAGSAGGSKYLGQVLLLLAPSYQQGRCLLCDAATPPDWCSQEPPQEAASWGAFGFVAQKLALPKDAPAARAARRSSIPRAWGSRTPWA